MRVKIIPVEFLKNNSNFKFYIIILIIIVLNIKYYVKLLINYVLKNRIHAFKIKDY